MARVHHFRSSSCALALLSLVVAGCTPTGSTDKAKAPPRVTVAHPVVRELTDEDDYNGWLEAYATVDVRSRVRGHIQAIHFKDGDFVTKGQLLFELDPRPFQVEINRETANARALDAQKIAAKKDLARYTELVKTGAASRQDVDKAQADADSYDARIAALLEQIKGHEARSPIFEDRRRFGRQDRQGESQCRQPRQRRWDGSGVGNHCLRRSDLHRLQRRRTGDAELPEERPGPGGQGRASAAAPAGDPLLVPIGHGRRLPAPGSSRFRRQ